MVLVVMILSVVMMVMMLVMLMMVLLVMMAMALTRTLLPTMMLQLVLTISRPCCTRC